MVLGSGLEEGRFHYIFASGLSILTHKAVQHNWNKTFPLYLQRHAYSQGLKMICATIPEGLIPHGIISRSSNEYPFLIVHSPALLLETFNVFYQLFPPLPASSGFIVCIHDSCCFFQKSEFLYFGNCKGSSLYKFSPGFILLEEYSCFLLFLLHYLGYHGCQYHPCYITL